MKSNLIVAATRQSAAIFPKTSHRRFPKRRYDGLATFALCLLTSAFCPRARVQSYSIDWFTIDGGGGSSTGGVFSVSGTIGQPDAGAMSGGNYTVDGGFWGLIAAVQTPGAPLLTITRSSTNSVILSWLAPATGFVLEENPMLSTTNWTNVGTSPATNGPNLDVVVPSPLGSRFYRLRHP
jgi:hypothetical protein